MVYDIQKKIDLDKLDSIQQMDVMLARHSTITEEVPTTFSSEQGG